MFEIVTLNQISLYPHMYMKLVILELEKSLKNQYIQIAVINNLFTRSHLIVTY